jgi:hypothetical protein
MGNAKTGQNVWVGLGIQNAKDSVAQIATIFAVTDLSGIIEEYSAVESQRRLATRFKGAGYLGTKQVPFGFSVEANSKDIGRILYAAFGAEAGSALSTPTRYQHTFTPAEELPYITLAVYTAGVADSSGTEKFHLLKNGKINSLEINGSLDAPVSISVEGIATEHVEVAVSFSGTVAGVENNEVTVTSTEGLMAGMYVTANATAGDTTTQITSIDSDTQFTVEDDITGATSFAVEVDFTIGKPFFTHSDEGTTEIKIGSTLGGATAFAEAREMSLSVANGISADRRINNSSTPYGMREGESGITGSFGVLFNEDSYTEIEAFQAGNDRGIDITLNSKNLISGTTYESLEFKITQARYSGSPPSFDPDVISAELPFTVEVAEGFEVILIDSVDHKYDAADTTIT